MNDIKTETISINGLSDLEKNMMDLPDRIARNVLVGATRAGANVIRDEARLRSRVAETTLIKKFKGQKVEVKPGFMKKKIAAWRTKRTKYPVTFNVGVAGYKDRFSRLFAFWWRFLEFGTSKMAASPFVRPAFEAKKQAAVERFRDYGAKRIEKEAKKRGHA